MADWITTSNWLYHEYISERPCSGAMDRDDRQIWWYKIGRDDDIQVGDSVLVYQTGSNDEARKEGIHIDEEIKCCFIGNFTIQGIIERNGHPERVCWKETYDGWLETVEHPFLWPPNEFIRRIDINDNLLVIAAGWPDLSPKKVGLIFRYKTWIRLEGNEGLEYYNSVMQIRNHN